MSNSKKIKVKIEGITPLIMHCDKACIPLHPLNKKIKEITTIRNKTDEHYLALARIEYEAAMYYDEELGVHMPSKCLHGCIKSAAKKYKLGKQTKAIMLDEAIGYPLIPYKGKTIEELYNILNKDGGQVYVFVENVRVGTAKVMRTRPIFNKWCVEFNLYLDTELLQEKDLRMILDTAGYEYGLCELRPGLANGNYGKFEVKEFKEIK